MKKIFVIEGIDGSGKQTQTTKLVENLEKLNINTFTTSFPNYDSQSSGPVKEYLNGNISKNPNDISPKAASTFYSVDRYITFNNKILPYYKDDKTVIVLDRYTQSNLIHQGGKLIENENSKIQLDEFYKWLYNFEYNDLELPKPTAVIFLYIPTEYTLSLTKNRINKFSEQKEKDIHEKNIKHLLDAEKAALYYAHKLGWHTIECIRDNKIRTIEDISSEILSIVKNYL